MDTYGRVCQILAKILHVRAETITRDMSLLSDFDCDSMDITEIRMAIEEEFHIILDDEVFAELTTVGKIVDWVEAHQRSGV